MSTSGLKGYINNGEYQAQYVSHDAYPSGLGWDFYKDCKDGFIDLIEENKIEFIKTLYSVSGLTSMIQILKYLKYGKDFKNIQILITHSDLNLMKMDTTLVKEYSKVI